VQDVVEHAARLAEPAVRRERARTLDTHALAQRRIADARALRPAQITGLERVQRLQQRELCLDQIDLGDGEFAEHAEALELLAGALESGQGIGRPALFHRERAFVAVDHGQQQRIAGRAEHDARPREIRRRRVAAQLARLHDAAMVVGAAQRDRLALGFQQRDGTVTGRQRRREIAAAREHDAEAFERAALQHRIAFRRRVGQQPFDAAARGLEVAGAQVDLDFAQAQLGLRPLRRRRRGNQRTRLVELVRQARRIDPLQQLSQRQVHRTRRRHATAAAEQAEQLVGDRVGRPDRTVGLRLQRTSRAVWRDQVRPRDPGGSATPQRRLHQMLYVHGTAQIRHRRIRAHAGGREAHDAVAGHDRKPRAAQPRGQQIHHAQAQPRIGRIGHDLGGQDRATVGGQARRADDEGGGSDTGRRAQPAHAEDDHDGQRGDGGDQQHTTQRPAAPAAVGYLRRMRRRRGIRRGTRSRGG
jgi:hypothetical protein